MLPFQKRSHRWLLAVTVVAAGGGLVAPAALFRTRHFAPDAALDVKTYVAPSTIPGAGNGLFAARDLLKGEPIAEMGGTLAFEADFPPERRGYLVKPPQCAQRDVWPFDVIDGRELASRASKINFAPRVINGVETGLQNARGREMCRRPYVFFEATRDIPRDTEILTSYGGDYGYDFMELEPVRSYFCQVMQLDCSQRFDWKP